ncbi:MAG TPA: hypothetical protein VGG22_01920 [Candidatus Baltobacteraceae bacterium]|jgi:hypothetical protein
MIVTAEPGEPSDGESYSGALDDLMTASQEFPQESTQILDVCWPNSTMDVQLRKTWITAAVLCSARISGKSIPLRIENACGEMYLAPQLRSPDFVAQHPSARPVTRPQDSWNEAGHAFQAWLRR